MSRTFAAICAAALGVAATAAGVVTANAADPAEPGFTTVRSLGFTAQSLTSPRPGRVLVAGLDAAKKVVVEDQVDGKVVGTQHLDATTDRVRVVSSGDNIWLLATGTTATLWRMQGDDFARQELPANVLTGGTSRVEDIAVEGTTVALFTDRRTGGWADHAVARLDGASWTVTKVETHPTASYGPAGMTLTAGHVLADWHSVPAPYAWQGFISDFTAIPRKDLLGTWTSSRFGQYEWTAAAMTAASPTDVTAWGKARRPGKVQYTYDIGGECKHSVNGTVVACPAPAYAITAAARLADGRQLVGGEDTVASSGGNGPHPVVQGGYALAAKDGTLTAVAGDPGTKVAALTVEPGTTCAWALVTNGSSSSLQQADLSTAGPTPTPTATSTTTAPAPAPTVTVTATKTVTATVTATKTVTAPAPTPTKTKKPKKPHGHGQGVEDAPDSMS